MKLILMFVAMCLAGNGTVNDTDTLVICPPDFRKALKPWVEHRQQQGYKVTVQDAGSTFNGVADQIQKQAGVSPLKHVVLIGDAVDEDVAHHRLVPTGYVAAKVNVKFGSELEIATDHSYADLNNDGIVDLNIGRIPVDTPDELTTYVKRLIEYESNPEFGDWSRRVNFVAGAGGFGQLLDKMIEQSVKKIVTDLIPPEFDTKMTYGSWRSPYCPDPRRFSETAISRFNEGCLFWIYVGHGDRTRLDRINMPDRPYNILDNETVHQIRAENGSPIALFLSCYTASIDSPRDGLGEKMIKQSKGPVAIISSSRVSMPYAMSIFSLEMLDNYFQGDVETLGELVTASKRGMVDFDSDKSEYHRLIESLGKGFSPEPKLLAAERREHVHLMHLLGDPLLKLHRAKKLQLTSPQKADAGDSILVEGVAEQAGVLNLDLAYERDRFRVRPRRRKSYEATDEKLGRYQEVYERTQNLICTSQTIDVAKGPFKIELTAPVDSSGDCHVRGQLKTPGFVALGASKIFIRSRRSAESKTTEK